MCKYLKQYLIIWRSDLFDQVYYLINYPEVRNMDIDPLMHFVKVGWKEGKNPSNDFNTEQYLEEHPELSDTTINPFIHYIQHRKEEGRSFLEAVIAQLRYLYEYYLLKRSDLFDSAYYLRTYEDIRRADVNPLMHFIKIGWREGRNPSKKFLTSLYLELNQDVAYAGLNPLVHFNLSGKDEKRIISDFHLDDSQLQYADLSSHDSRMQSIQHYANLPPKTTDIIVFPIIDWEFRYQRPQHLASELSEGGHRVFYIKTYFHSRKAPLIINVKENIYSVQLPSCDPSLEINTILSDQHVDDFASSMRMLRDHFLINSAVMLVDLPFWRKLVVRLKEDCGWEIVFDFMDLFTEFSLRSPDAAIDEQFLLQNSDLVLTSSSILYQLATKENEHTILLHNATDFEHFHQASKPMDIREFRKYSSPIIGYYGAIADWFDTKLVGELASENPQWTFVLIGDTELADLAPLTGLKNVHLLGEKPYSEIPGFLSHFDVCIIPFKQISLTHATNPLKLFEYLSAGKPVVATRLDEISTYEEFVRLAGTKQEWEAAINESLMEQKSPELLNKRYDFAKENTWQLRGERLESEIFSLFPTISIIIITFNNLEYTKLCLESINKNTSYPNYEIIIVDNGSESDTVDYLNDFQLKHENTILVMNEKNVGFAKANNQGFSRSKGEYIIFLNNDTIVTPGWMSRLLHHLRHDSSVGMVGPVTNAIGNEAKIDITYQDLAGISEFAAHQAKNFAGKKFAIKVLALYCAMISRELIDSVGGLDERYEVGMFEDDDLALKIRQKGYELICAEDVFVHHFHGVTFNLLREEDYLRIFMENKARYERKWGIKWEPHQYRQG